MLNIIFSCDDIQNEVELLHFNRVKHNSNLDFRIGSYYSLIKIERKISFNTQKIWIPSFLCRPEFKFDIKSDIRVIVQCSIYLFVEIHFHDTEINVFGFDAERSITPGTENLKHIFDFIGNSDFQQMFSIARSWEVVPNRILIFIQNLFR